MVGSQTTTLNGDFDGRVSGTCTKLSPGMELKHRDEKQYLGGGTVEDPLVVRWLPDDPQCPYNWPRWKKYCMVMLLAVCTLVVSFGSSGYVGAIDGLRAEFHVSSSVAILGLSLYVLGFALGPLIWAPFSEVVGRRAIFICAGVPHVLFILGASLALNMPCMLVSRFLCGFGGSASLNNNAAAISDAFDSSERALALSLFACASFLGPVIGPIVGGFAGELQWRWIFWIQFILAAIVFTLGGFIPESYSPVLLRRIAKKLSQETGLVHVSEFDLLEDTTESIPHMLFVASYRPFLMLYHEAIVLALAVYIACVYGILYCLFGAFPIVFQENRGWSAGAAGLPFLGVGIGMVGATFVNIQVNKKYTRDLAANNGYLPPEARLPVAIVGGALLPVGLFWFAWTVQPSVHFIVPCIASVPFGLGMVLLFLALTNYMVDSYPVFSASALAANAVFRSIFGAAFPLFTTQMFHKLGSNWALTLVAFLTLLLVPIPYVFMRYGHIIRRKSRYGAAGEPPEAEHKTKEAAWASTGREEDLVATASRISSVHS